MSSCLILRSCSSRPVCAQVLKLAADKSIHQAYHGTRRLTREQINNQYPTKRIEFDGHTSARFWSLTTYFETNFAGVFVHLVDWADAQSASVTSYDVHCQRIYEGVFWNFAEWHQGKYGRTPLSLTHTNATTSRTATTFDSVVYTKRVIGCLNARCQDDLDSKLTLPSHLDTFASLRRTRYGTSIRPRRRAPGSSRRGSTDFEFSSPPTRLLSTSPLCSLTTQWYVATLGTCHTQ